MPRTEQRSERALPRAAGETRAGAALRRDARMQCARALRDAFDAACASLCKETADAAAQFIRAPRREGDVRVAVVRAGFCGRCRGVAAAALAGALHRANVKALRVEDRWQLDDENDDEAAVVVARAEATGAAGLRDALAALPPHIVGVVVVAGATWRLPTGLPSALRAQTFRLPHADAFADAFLSSALRNLPCAVGARALVGWLEGYEQHGDPAQLACRAQLAVLEHFRRPGAFLATAIFVDDPASQSLALAEAAPDLDANDVDALARALRSRAVAARVATTWAAAALTTSGTAPRRWRAAAACALPLSPGPSLDAQDAAVTSVKQASPATLATLLDAWRCRAVADDVPRAVAARTTELAAVAHAVASAPPSKERSRRCRFVAHEAASLLTRVSRAGRQLSELPLAPLVIVDGAGHAPSGLWTATTRLLQTADVPAATAWRAAAAGLAGDAKRWALAVRGERDDGNERTLAFAKAVRDLHYAGLVASKRGRFSAVTT